MADCEEPAHDGGHKRPPREALLAKVGDRLVSGLTGAVTPTWISAARGLENALTSGRGGGSPRPERFVS